MPLVRLQAILTDCKRFTDKRNDLIHGLWAQELDGDAHIRDSHGNTRPIPTTTELRDLARELAELTGRLNTERLEGFLSQALSKREHSNEDA
jgi:hypothetical protein